MSDLRQAAAAALEALEGVLDTYGEPLDKLSIAGGTYEALYCRDAITALRAALEKPEQERHFCGRCGKRLHAESIHTCTPPEAA